jgi:DNA-binding transcriptional regulator YiaG
MFANFPINFSRLPKEKLDKLISLIDELKQAMNSATSFKLNAGRNVGNYNLAKCRHVTDLSDRIFANYLGIDDIWEDLEFLYSQVVKTDFSY